MKIIQLKAENVKRLAAVCITPNPETSVVVLAGQNGSGKSSCLDSILYALAGGRAIPELPVRRGEERAVIELDLDELKVRRTISANGNTTLVVTQKDGTQAKSPQAILDSLLGKLSFDPLEFSRQKPAEQYETLRALAGLDFTAIEKQRQKAYDSRTVLGREIKNLEGQLNGLPSHTDVPETEVSTADIMQKWREASTKNEANNAVRAELGAAKQRLESVNSNLTAAQDVVTDIEAQIRALQVKLERQQKIIEGFVGDRIKAQAWVDLQEKEAKALVDVDITPFQSDIQNAETINRKVRQNQQRAKVQSELQGKRRAHTDLDHKIESLDVEKRRMISKTKLPIDGLAFEAGRVLFNAIPFAQLSSAEQLKISVAVGIALNPKLRVLLIRDGSLLDDGNLKMLGEMAAASDSQVWLERCGTDGECSVIIEDGLVKGAKDSRSKPRTSQVVEQELIP